MPPILPDQEFHFDFNLEEPIRAPFRLGEVIALPPHKRIYYQADKVRADSCPSLLGTVIRLGEPLDSSGSSYIANALCSNPSCDFVSTVRA